MIIKIILKAIFDGLHGFRMMFLSGRRDRFGEIHPTSLVYQPCTGAKQNVYLSENTVIHEGARFITAAGRFIMKRNSTASFNLTVITFNHKMGVGDMPNSNFGEYHTLLPEDVNVDEGVLIGANVTLLPGAHIPRGCVVGANSVVTRAITPPHYSILAGNPARFIRFRFSLEDQLKHEEICYDKSDRISKCVLEKNWYKYNPLPE